MNYLKFVMMTTFYPPYHIGGDAVHVYHLSNELAKLGHEIHVIHNIDSYRWQCKGDPLNNYPNHENITVHPIKSSIGKISPLVSYVFGPYLEAKIIKKIIWEIKPDIIHHHNIAGFGPFIFDLIAPKILYTAHDYWSVCPMNGLINHNGDFCNGRYNCLICSILSRRPPQLWRYTKLLRRKFKNIDKIISPSEYMKNRLQTLGIDGNFTVVPNFVPEPPKIETVLYNFHYFLFVGVLEKHKGILNLVDEYINNKNEIDAKLLIVGNGSLEKRIKNTIVKNHCEDKIIMLGRIDNYLTLANIYSNAIAVVIPSICPDNCPTVGLEALSNKTPIIVSDKGGLPELISISNAGIVMKDCHIANFLKDRHGLRMLSESIKNNPNRYFSSQYYIKRYLEVIKN